MTSRRSIFKTIAGALCAAAIEVCGVELTMPKAGKVVANPEWLSAEYEDVLLAGCDTQNTNNGFVRTDYWIVRKQRIVVDGKDESSQWSNREKGIFVEQIRRLNLIDGQYVEVYPYIFEP